MLRIDFLNVGDGDAILIREIETDYVLLCDCGRPHIEFVAGSKRAHVINHLMRMGIGHIDLIVLTHLHFDHIGGVQAILRHIPVKKALVGYLPPKDARWIFAPASEQKSVVGLCDALNFYRDAVVALEQAGATCVQAKAETLRLTDRLSLSVRVADDELLLRQKALFDGLYHGETFLESEIHRVSKDRNCSSLRLRATYAGRSALLGGDSYAAYWEDEPEAPCDILKLPHHGDDKSLTEKLLARLNPTYAVVSCQNDPNAKKERPAQTTVAMLLQGQVPHILCTENRPMPNLAPTTQDAISFLIGDDGTIRVIAE